MTNVLQFLECIGTSHVSTILFKKNTTNDQIFLASHQWALKDGSLSLSKHILKKSSKGYKRQCSRCRSATQTIRRRDSRKKSQGDYFQAMQMKQPVTVSRIPSQSMQLWIFHDARAVTSPGLTKAHHRKNLRPPWIRLLPPKINVQASASVYPQLRPPQIPPTIPPTSNVKGNPTQTSPPNALLTTPTLPCHHHLQILLSANGSPTVPCLVSANNTKTRIERRTSRNHARNQMPQNQAAQTRQPAPAPSSLGNPDQSRFQKLRSTITTAPLATLDGATAAHHSAAVRPRTSDDQKETSAAIHQVPTYLPRLVLSVVPQKLSTMSRIHGDTLRRTLESVLSGRDGRPKKKLGCTATARGDTTEVALRIDHRQDEMTTRMMRTITALVVEEAGTATTTHSHMADPSIDERESEPNGLRH